MNKTTILILFSFFTFRALSQEPGLMEKLEDSVAVNEKITAAFKSTRVINAHSIEMLAKGSLDVRILHRFGLVDRGISEMFGLDEATMRMGLDYGISKNLMVGLGRSTYRKEVDAFAKARLLHQTTGKGMPVSLLVAAGYLIRTETFFSEPKPDFVDRTSYYVQMIAGRKFNDKFSLQLSPVFIYSNLPFNSKGDQALFAAGAGGRYKISRRVAITFDYHYPVADMDSMNTAPLSIGFDIETGGHVFQLHFSNAVGMNERAYIAETSGKFFEGNIRFGFNLSRIFYIRRSY